MEDNIKAALLKEVMEIGRDIVAAGNAYEEQGISPEEMLSNPDSMEGGRSVFIEIDKRIEATAELFSVELDFVHHVVQEAVIAIAHEEMQEYLNQEAPQ